MPTIKPKTVIDINVMSATVMISSRCLDDSSYYVDTFRLVKLYKFAMFISGSAMPRRRDEAPVEFAI
jgi:hypothetical protein